MEALLAEKAMEWERFPQGRAVIDEARREIDLYRAYSEFYGYAFFVMRRGDGDP